MKTIYLSNSKSETFIDDEDYPVISRLNWYLSDMGYAITDSPVKHLKLHKLLIGPIPPKTVIDHIDRNKLNNQKSNLRIVSQRENTHNSFKYENAKHFYFDKNRNTWIIEFKNLGIRSIPAKSPTIASRIVTRIKLGFPPDVAKKEANNPTISISNWSTHNIKYEEYLKSLSLGITIQEMRNIYSRRRASDK